MRTGAVFLADEISLADDSVLERMNSVLEPERSILLAERVGGQGEDTDTVLVTAHQAFRYLGQWVGKLNIPDTISLNSGS